VADEASNFDTSFSVDDWDLVFEALDSWECGKGELLSMIQHLKNMPPLPDEADPDFVKYIQKLKDHYLPMEREAKETQKVRKERGAMVKVKVLLRKQNAGIDSLLADARNTDLLEDDEKSS